MSYLDPYLSYISKYVDWRTAVSCGTFALILAVTAAAVVVFTRNRSS